MTPVVMALQRGPCSHVLPVFNWQSGRAGAPQKQPPVRASTGAGQGAPLPRTTAPIAIRRTDQNTRTHAATVILVPQMSSAEEAAGHDAVYVSGTVDPQGLDAAALGASVVPIVLQHPRLFLELGLCEGAGQTNASRVEITHAAHPIAGALRDPPRARLSTLWELSVRHL